MNNYMQQPYYNKFQPYGYYPNYQYQNTQPFTGGNQPTQNNMQQPVQPIQQPIQQPMQQTIGIQGKSVDSIDVVKAMEIPLDGSVSYFPLTDGSAIVTKQLQIDGTSKTVIYKPVQMPEKVEESKFILTTDMQKKLEEYDENKEQIKVMKEQIENLKIEVEDLLKNVNKNKEGKK